MPNFLKDLCSMICGEDRVQCITANNKEVTCVADMVVNQAYGILSVVDLIKHEQDADTAAGYLEEIHTISNELINWAKYLQVTHDVQSVARHMDIKESGLRREVRYPFPEDFREFVSLKVEGPMDPVKATIVNFSQSGIQFSYDGPPPTDPALVCTLMSHERIGKRVGLLCEVKYFAEHEGRMLIGAQIVEVSDSPDFNFFMSILDMMSEAASFRQKVS